MSDSSRGRHMSIAQERAERNLQIIEAYTAGEKMGLIAERFGISVPAIYRVLRRQRVKLRGARELPPLKVQRNAELVRRYQEGETLNDLGQAFDLTRERVRQILVREGCIERHRGKAKRARGEVTMIRLVCPLCGKRRVMQPSRAKVRKDEFCSVKCRVLADENHLGRRAYLLRRDERLSWAEISRRIGSANSTAAAKRWAVLTGWRWPLKEVGHVRDVSAEDPL